MEYQASISANIANCEIAAFLQKLYATEDLNTKRELEDFLHLTKISFNPQEFTQHEYLASLEQLNINEDKNTFSAMFTLGGGAIEFCSEFYAFLKAANAKKIKIKLTDDESFEEVDWRTFDISLNKPVKPLKKPKTLLNGGSTGIYDLTSASGKVLGLVRIEAGHLNGEQRILNKYGEDLCIINFKTGVPNGEVHVYFSGGKISAQFAYKKGLLDGPFLSWEKNGHLLIKANYKNGLLNGNQTIHKSEKLLPELDANYMDGQLNGPVTWQTRVPTDKTCASIFQNGRPSTGIRESDMYQLEALEEHLAPHESLMIFIEPSSFYKIISNHILAIRPD